MAHEIGHLLLASGEHSAAGLMRARWSTHELERMAWGRLRFEADEPERQREGVARRRRQRDVLPRDARTGPTPLSTP